MSRRCTAKPEASARDLFIRDLFIGGKFENIVYKLKYQIKQTNFHKSQKGQYADESVLKPGWKSLPLSPLIFQSIYLVT